MDTLVDQTLNCLPLLSNQKRLWIISQEDYKNPAYNIQLTYHFKGKIDYDVLKKSIGLLFNKHHTMFSVFKQAEGEPYIEIIPGKVLLEFVDFSFLPVGDRLREVLAFASQDSRRRFDIEKGPLYRLYLLKENDESYYFHGTIHHLIFDGWSRRVFINELSSIYKELINGKDYAPEPVGFQSYNYAAIEKKYLTVEKENELIEFWKDNLKDCPTELGLPYDYSRGNKRSGFGKRESFEIPREFTAKLKDIAKQSDTSLFNTMLSILALVLHKYSGENDICIGVPVSNRRFHPGLDKILGLFINTVVVRLKLEDGNSFKDQINFTKEVIKKALNHSRLPFEKVVEAANPERIPGINPLFQVSLSWLTDLTIPLDFGTLKGERVTLPEGISPFDLTFYMWDEGEVIKGDIEYSTDVFCPDTIKRLRDSFLHLSYTLATKPSKLISEIPLVSPAELTKLAGFDGKKSEVPDVLIQKFFEEQALLNSAKTAVICGKNSSTYKKLNDQANQLAWCLLSTGLTAGETVGICLDRSIEMIISVLAVLKSGCCYLPLDPSFPEERIKYMFEDSGAGILITESSLKNKFLEFTGRPVILIDTDKEKITGCSTENPVIHISNLSPAYIIYTSGSTNRPKGVKVHHQAVVNLIESMSVTPGIKEQDILLAVVTLSFDMSVFELFLPLSKGATIVLAQSNDTTDAEALVRLIEKFDISIIQATPSFWGILLSGGWKGKKNLKALVGGEALTKNMIRQILPKVAEFWNCYGPTETTVYSTCTLITDVDAPIQIGRPINNTTIHIVDKNYVPLPIGAIGEVCIEGLGVAEGYINQPLLTSEKFIRIENNNLVYKTGDLGRFLQDGNIELFGRIDNQIKLRGFRIEPGEIESLLTGLPNVKEAVVKVIRFDDNDERLIAFLNTDNNFNSSNEEIKSILSNKLPPYMIPSFFQKSDGFPRLPNGKINKKALVYRKDDSDQENKINLNSLTSTQKKLLTIWESILKTKVNDISEIFFNSGGNSLLGIRLINKIREEFGITLTFSELVSNPSIQKLYVIIDNQANASDESVNMVHLTELKNLPLTKNQQRLWLLSSLNPEKPLYIIRSTYELIGFLNMELFIKSIDILFQRHHIVFSTFKKEDLKPTCDIRAGKADISYLDYSDLSQNEAFGMMEATISQSSQKVFDLENGPLYRLYLIKTRNDVHYFHMSIHHIIFDGWSQGVFINDFNEIYNCLLTGNNANLEKLEFQQYDYANWEKNQVAGKESVMFWEEYLRGCSPLLNFPFDFQRGESSTGKGALEEIRFPNNLSQTLRRISTEEGIPLFTTLMSAFGVLLHRYSGDNDLNIGLPVAYRPHSKLEKIFGMFVNTLVIRLKYENIISFREMIKQSNKEAMNVLSHQDTPFETVVEVTKPVRIEGTNPLFQVAFAWQNNLSVGFNLEGITSNAIKGKVRGATFDLTLALWENGDTIEGEIEYNTDILQAETVNRLKNHFLTLVNNLVEDIDVPVNSVRMISEEEIRIIDEVNNTTTNYPKEKTIAQIFEEHAQSIPDNIAISFKDISLTYRQLNERSNQIARELRKSGVKLNSAVGLLSDKSPEMIIGIIGILKAGGCYTPLDPGYPDERKCFIAKDSGIKVLLAQSKYMGIEIDSVEKLDINSKEVSENETSDLKCLSHPEDLAYILYTSGTTGTPKGTPITNRGAIRLVCNTNYYNFTAEDRTLFAGALVFDASTMEIWSALLNGGRLHIIEKETLLDPEILEEEIQNNGITNLVITSALFNHLVENKISVFNGLKYLMIGGDVISPDHANRVRRQNPDLSLFNGYGPTENSCMSAYYKVEKDFYSRIPIGKPNSNSTAYIFDKDMNYQPVGVPGELYVGGDGVSPGYLNRDDLNRTHFIRHPFKPDERLYKTGDLVRWLPDWNIDFLGRTDNQLKIRGFRIELEEIESVISEFDGVIETVVKPFKIEHGDYKLIAFLNVQDNFSTVTQDIIENLKTKLPSYMIPSTIQVMHGFPKTINGKTDRKSLFFDSKDLEKKELLRPDELLPVEQSIYNLWSELLKTSDISVTDNFFDVGGNSLLTMSLASSISKKFNIMMNSIMVFRYPTIKAQSDFISGRSDSDLHKRGLDVDEKSSRRKNVNFRKTR